MVATFITEYSNYLHLPPPPQPNVKPDEGWPDPCESYLLVTLADTEAEAHTTTHTMLLCRCLCLLCTLVRGSVLD